MAIEDNKINIKVGMNTRGFQKGMKTMQGGFKRLNGAIGAFSAGFVGTQVFGVVKGLADMAGEAEKTELRFKRVFGNMSTSVSVFSSQLSTDLGRVETDVKSGMVSFQAFFQGLGFGGKEAANMSMKMQGLSYDLASFFNIQDDNAQKRFLAALAGSPEVLDQFGINLKQAALQVELYDMGVTSTVQNTDELTKTQGRLNIIMRAMSSNGILGDAQRTMSTWDNTVKRTFASLKTLGIAIGDFILPALKGFLEAVILVTDGINSLLGLDKNEIDLNKEKQKEYENLTTTLVNADKGTQSYKLSLQKLIAQYPDFWNNIDHAKMSQEELKEAVADSSKQFEVQNRILAKKNLLEETIENYSKVKDELIEVDKVLSDLRNKKPSTETRAGAGMMSVEKKTTQKQIDEDIVVVLSKQEEVTNRLNIAEMSRNMAQSAFNFSLNETTLTYEQMYRLVSEGIAANEAELAASAAAEKQRQKDLFDDIKRRHDLLKFISSIQRENSAELRELHAPLEAAYNFYQDLVDAGLDFNKELGFTVSKLNALEEQIAKMDLFIPISMGFKVGDVGGQFSKAAEEVKAGAIQIIDILRPITDAMSQIWMQMLTPPDTTISKEEQREKTLAAFGGIMVGLGQALFSLGMGSLLTSMGLDQLGKNPPLAIAMMGAGSGLIAIGKGKLQKARNMASARTAGGGASGGNGGGSFTGMMEAIQGEQVFRLAGNDLVTAINRTNTFQGTIGG